MTEKLEQKHTFRLNVIYAFTSQFISLALSIVKALILPKILGVSDYGYFQLFLFYSNYSGVALLGLNDGIYLKMGGLTEDDLDKQSLGNQWKLSTCFQIVMATGLLLYVQFFDTIGDSNRLFVIASFFIYMVLFNTCGYFGYIYQAVNDTKVYSKSIMIDRSAFIICLFASFVFRTSDYRVYVVLFILSKLISTIYVLNKAKSFVFVQLSNIKKACLEMLSNMSVGIFLLIANLASMLILGIGRFMIDSVWGIEAFSKFSFSLSLTSFFLQFISQVSMVLFPMLRKFESNKLNDLYTSINLILLCVLPLCYLAYPIIYQILILWLPHYAESLRYLILLLPICVFDGKMNLLYSTYFKVLRMEKELLWVNIVSMAISAALSVISVFVLKEILAVLISMVMSIAFRSIIASKCIEKRINIDFTKETIFEIFYSFVFIILAWFTNNVLTTIVLLAIYGVCMFIYKKRLADSVSILIEEI